MTEPGRIEAEGHETCTMEDAAVSARIRHRMGTTTRPHPETVIADAAARIQIVAPMRPLDILMAIIVMEITWVLY